MLERVPRSASPSKRQLCFTTQLVDGMVEVKLRYLPSHFTDEILNRSPSPESQASISGASGCLPAFTRNTAWLSSDPQVP